MKKDKEIYKILSLLEAQIGDPIVKKTPVKIKKNIGEIEALSIQHLKNEKEIQRLQERIENLLQKQNEIQDSNTAIQNQIVKMIGDTKEQTIRFGKIIVEFKINVDTKIAPNRPQYAKVVDALQKQYHIETKIINELKLKYNNVGEKTEIITKELNITKEGKQLVKENVGKSIKILWQGIKQVFTTLFNSFKNNNDKLEKILQTQYV